MRALVVAVVAVIAAVIGFYAGFLALLRATGLDAPHAVPAAGLAGAGLLVGLVAGVGWRHRPTTVAVLALITMTVGSALGALVEWLGLDLSWVIVAGLALIACAMTVAARTGGGLSRDNTTSP